MPYPKRKPGAAKNFDVPRMTNRLSNSVTKGMAQISSKLSENSIYVSSIITEAPMVLQCESI